MKGRVFIGINNIAGVGINLMEGFRQNGIKADFYSAEKTIHPYNYTKGYSPNMVPHSKNRWVSRIKLIFFLIKILFRYKYFIYLQAGWTLIKDQLDIRILHLFGKKTMVILTGCDARIPEKVEEFKWNPCSDCTDEYKQFLNCDIPMKKALIPELEKKFDHVVSADECAGLLTRPYTTIYYPRVIGDFQAEYPKVTKKDKIRILHAPSNTHYKGTKYVKSSIAILQSKHYNFEYIEVQGLSINDLYEVIKSCNLVIDQMIGGYYGLLGVESMAFGKPVVAYIRPDIWNKISTDCPVYNANPDNLTEVLEKILLEPEQLEERGRQSRKYVEKYHDAHIVAGELFSILNS